MIDLSSFCKDLNLDNAAKKKLEPVWQNLIKDFSGIPFFLKKDFFDQYYPLCHGVNTPEFYECAYSVIRIAEEKPAAALLAHIMYRGIFILKPIFKLDFLPKPLPLFGEERAGMLNLMVSMGVYPLTRKVHDEMGIPEHYAKDLMGWLGGTTLQYAAAHGGRPGANVTVWIRLHTEKKLFRIGRFEYLLHTCPEWLPAIFRNKADGRLAVLNRDNWHYQKNGKRVDENAEYEYSTQLIITPETVTGVPIAADGNVDFTKTVTLKRSEWIAIATPWEYVPSMHIPGGCPMPFDAVKESMIEAREFFRKYLSVEPPLFCCCSWILNPAWEKYMPRSNMARFRREGFAFPTTPWGDKSGMNFLFGRDDVSPLDLPAVNTAQKAFQEAFRNDDLAAGGVFFLTEELEKLGDEYYRKNKFCEKFEKTRSVM